MTRTRCEKCDGMGRVTCPSGLGTMTCQTCDGQGEIRTTGRFFIGQHVATEYGTGIVRETSARRVYIELDAGDSLNVATGTYGYERIAAVSA